MDDIQIITLDGNIGAGKSTLLKKIEEYLPYVEIVFEPVPVWESLKCNNDKNILQHFYEDSIRWGYTFQNCALLTRIIAVKDAIEKAKKSNKKVIITERSVLTDINVFAKMNKNIGNLSELEWNLYLKWVDAFSNDKSIKAIIHVTTCVETCIKRIKSRARKGEDIIPEDYLHSLSVEHYNWCKNTKLPVLNISTETDINVTDNIEKIKEFIKKVTNI